MEMMSRLLQVCVAAAVLMALPAAICTAAEPAAVITDICYKQIGDTRLCLDLHMPPATSPKPYPLVVFAHGGGWSKGSKTIGDKGVRFLAVRELTGRGFCVASVDYRLCGETSPVTMRDCVTDTRDALRFLAKEASRYSLDPAHIFTFGDSAGGHIAQMVLLAPASAFPGDPRLADAQYTLCAGVSWYGPCDFEKTELFLAPGQTQVADRFGNRIIGSTAQPEERLRAYREVSPVNYLTASSPPLLMIQGDQDTTIPVHHAHFAAERARQTGAPVEILIVKNAARGWNAAGGTPSPSVDEIVRATADFIQKHLKPTP